MLFLMRQEQASLPSEQWLRAWKLSALLHPLSALRRDAAATVAQPRRGAQEVSWPQGSMAAEGDAPASGARERPDEPAE